MVKGTKHSKETLEKISKNRRGHGGMKQEKNPNWKGNDVGYWGIHKWITRLLGQPRHCALCNTTTAKKYEWCNISHAYKRELSDWIRLCTKCHIGFDKGKIKLTIS